MSNKIILAILILSGMLLSLQAVSEYEKEYTMNTINIQSSTKYKTFIKEYRYNASDNDSKNSSRKIAIAELKSLISEEIGVHIQSSFNITKTLTNKVIKKEILQLSTSITQLKILDENWNGKTYYIKASVQVNEEQAMRSLLDVIKGKASKKDIKRLTNELNYKNYKINELNKQITLSEFLNNESKEKSSLNLGFLMNQKYICIKKANILNDKVIKNENSNYKLRFYIDSNIILHTQDGLLLNNIAPQIYENQDFSITLSPINSNRYLVISDKKELNDSILLECTETKIWNLK